MLHVGLIWISLESSACSGEDCQPRYPTRCAGTNALDGSRLVITSIDNDREDRSTGAIYLRVPATILSIEIGLPSSSYRELLVGNLKSCAVRLSAYYLPRSLAGYALGSNLSLVSAWTILEDRLLLPQVHCIVCLARRHATSRWE